jgi:SAM-dependent methyltransferase
MTVVGYLHQKFPQADFQRQELNSATEILVAGCGTGQHPIGTAQRFKNAHVLAVDLSVSSLCYAKRKSREMGITCIEYAQADILKLDTIGRTFDLIESSGVLHHLADPWYGWHVLLSLLRPGGFMKLGFYSRIARRKITLIRKHIAEKSYGATVDDIRKCRQELLGNAGNSDFDSILKTPDFFSVSSCRDLLFHVQEHCLSLIEIDQFLKNNKLKFLGFEIDEQVLAAYKQCFPVDLAATDLVRWHAFENENPDIFFGMYQFWIQKFA